MPEYVKHLVNFNGQQKLTMGKVEKKVEIEGYYFYLVRFKNDGVDFRGYWPLETSRPASTQMTLALV
jgi:hypothetical protein